ncbi:MAG: oxidoreductase, partial [Acidobacteriota bacterium]|nr:oxidoreductase [Acidobacteriota bacterium]
MSRIAVVGGGQWGKNLVRNFYELGALTYVCDSDANRLQEIQRRYPGVSTCGDYKQLLTDKGIDGIVL